MRYLILILLILTASPAWGATYYVRPAGGTYGVEDGSDYDNAFDGFSNVAISDNDTLYVCGLHREQFVFADSNVTLRLDHSADPGKIYGSTQILGSAGGWTADGDEFYYSLATECNVVVRDGVILLEDDGGHDGDGVDANGWDWDTTDDRLYVKEDPSGYTVYEVGQLGPNMALVTFPNSDSITDFTIIGGGVGEIRYGNQNCISIGHDSWKNRVDDTTTRNYGDVTIDGVKIYGCAQQGVHFNANDNDTGNSTGQGADASNVAEVTWSNTWDNVTINDCEFYSCGGEAIYSGGNINTTYVITNNLITSDSTLGVAGWDNVDDPYSAYAGDGINGSPYGTATITGNRIVNVRGPGIAVGFHDGTIADNVIIDAGSSTDDWPNHHNGIYVDPQFASGEVVIERNFIKYVDRYGCGISFGGVSGTETPITIRNNIVSLPWSTTMACIENAGKHELVKKENNTLYGGLYGIFHEGSADPVSSTMKNNIFERNAYPYYSDRNDQSGMDATNNNFRSLASGAPANPYHTGDADYASVSAMDTGEATFSSNTEVDPKFVSINAGKWWGYRLRGGSPCINAGADLSGDFTDDYRGHKRPIGSAFDIGAFEYKYQTSPIAR